MAFPRGFEPPAFPLGEQYYIKNIINIACKLENEAFFLIFLLFIGVTSIVYVGFVTFCWNLVGMGFLAIL